MQTAVRGGANTLRMTQHGDNNGDFAHLRNVDSL